VSILNQIYHQKPPCANEDFRTAAQEQLDQLLEDYDGRKGWFGELKLIIPVANGQFSGLRTSQEQNHKVR
jgi:hypothetical protein